MTLDKSEMELLAGKLNLPTLGTKRELEDAIRDEINAPEYSAREILRNNAKAVVEVFGGEALANKLFDF